MAKWYYYNESAEKIGPIRGRELKQCALNGTITPNTRVEDQNGHTALAKRVTGLPFYVAAQPKMPPLAAPPVCQTPPQSIPVPNTNGNKTPHWIVLIGTIVLLVVVGIGVMVNASFSAAKKTEQVRQETEVQTAEKIESEQQTAATQAITEKIERERQEAEAKVITEKEEQERREAKAQAAKKTEQQRQDARQRTIEKQRKEEENSRTSIHNDNLWKGTTTWGNNRNVSFSKDTNTKFGGDYALKIQHSDYADSAFRKTIHVEKNTIYRVSAMVRYEGYELFPENAEGTGGANISIWGEWTLSERYTGNEWKRIELEFNSGNKTEIDLALRNGFFGGACKGTVWFSDIRIEKKDMTPSTSWNFLCLIFTDIDVVVEFKGNKNYRHTAHLSRADIAEITKTLNRVPHSFKNISNNLMRISNMDIITIQKPIAKLTGRYGEGYKINAKDIQESLDYYLDRPAYKYDQIIVVAPLGKLATGWTGLGGVFYRNVGYCQVSLNPGWKPRHWFADAIFVHETLHCIESRARRIREIASLHDAGTGKYGLPYDDGKDEWIEWYRAYMRNTLPDKKGLPPEVYTVYNSLQYTVISTDMRTRN